jgi:putative transposase
MDVDVAHGVVPQRLGADPDVTRSTDLSRYFVATLSVSPHGSLTRDDWQMKKRFEEEQIIRILREADVSGVQIRDMCRRHNITEQTFFRWRKKYGGLDVSDARKLKVLESENAKLKRLVAEQLLVIEGLKEFSGKK